MQHAAYARLGQSADNQKQRYRTFAMVAVRCKIAYCSVGAVKLLENKLKLTILTN
jgi:hypothetical protein